MKKKKQSKSLEQEGFDYDNFEKEAISKLKSGGDLLGTDGILTGLIQRIVNAALEGEMENHLETERQMGKSGNRRNGHNHKTLTSEIGEIPISTPRDRAGNFSPQIVEKWDRKLNSGLDTQVLELYGSGMGYLDIKQHLKKMYGADLSTGQLNTITDQVWPEIENWRKRALDSFYTLIYLDAIHFRIREDGIVKTKAVYTVYGVDASGSRDVLCLHVGQAEGAKEWGRVLEQLRERGVEDVLFFSVDGLTGFSQAILDVYPNSIVQRCIVHMIRTSLRFVDDKDSKAICKDLRKIYTADDEAQGLANLDLFAETWDFKYPEISKKWRNNWTELTAFFGHNKAVRRMIYTTNAIEALHRMMRKTTKTKSAFTNDKALLKLLYLTLQRKRKSWNRKVFNWSAVKRGLIREFGDRAAVHLEKF